MKKSQRERIDRFTSPYRVTSGKGFRLKDVDPGDTAHLKSEDKAEAKEMLARGVEWLAEEQDKLYAQDHWAVLLVFQAMDAAGKDGTIKHVTSGINPQGCTVTSFKQPSSEELDHDYLWRYMRNVPARGQIGIFNRSYYEELLVVKVHQELLARQKMHPSLVTKKIWDERYEDISNYEKYLRRNGVRGPQVLPARVEGRAEAPLHGTPGQPGEELEILVIGRCGAGALEGLPGGLRGGDPQHRLEGGALVRGARGQQVVHPGRGGCRRGGCHGWPEAALPRGGAGQAQGTGGGAAQLDAE